MMNANKAMGKRSGLSAMVLKAMGLFGGLQVFGIISSIVRTKLIALWIGPAGVGLFGLYNAALDMISSVTQLNMRSSAVRDIAKCGEDRGAIDIIAGVVRRFAVAERFGESFALGMLDGDVGRAAEKQCGGCFFLGNEVDRRGVAHDLGVAVAEVGDALGVLGLLADVGRFEVVDARRAHERLGAGCGHGAHGSQMRSG